MRKQWKRSAAAVLTVAMSLSTFLSAYAYNNVQLETPEQGWWSEENEAVLEWHAVPDLGYRDDRWCGKYRVEVYRDGELYWYAKVGGGGDEISRTRSFLHHGLDRSGTYKFRVQAKSSSGGVESSDWSEFSEEWNFQKAETELPKPVNLHWEGTVCSWDMPKLSAEQEQYLYGWDVTLYGDGKELDHSILYLDEGNSFDMAENFDDEMTDFEENLGAIQNWTFDVRALSNTPSKIFHGQTERCKEACHAEKQGWYEEDGEWHYYTKLGKLATKGFVAEKRKDSEKTVIYYVDETGKMLSDCRITIPANTSEELHSYGSKEADDVIWNGNGNLDRSYYAGSDGALVANKWIQTGEQQWIYASEDYLLACNELRKIRGKNYYFDENCYAQSGLMKLENKYGEEKNYYFDPESFAMVKDKWELIDDGDEFSLYYFTEDGSAQTEGEKTWDVNGITYEFDEDGRATISELMPDEWGDAIATPSTPSNAARLAKKALETGVEKYGSIEQIKYDTEEKAESFLDRLIAFFLAPFTDEIKEFEASPSDAQYQAAVNGTKDAPDGKDGYIKKDVELLHYSENADNERGAFTATASVALRITPEKYDPNAEEPDKPDVPEPDQPDVPEPEQPDKPDVPKPSKPSSIGGSGSGRSSARTTTATSGLTPTPGSWKLLENGQWMMLDPNGMPYRNTWLVYQNQWYFVNPDGIMEFGWKQIGGRWYYFTVTATAGQPVGSMLANTTTPDGYKVGADGAWIN